MSWVRRAVLTIVPVLSISSVPLADEPAPAGYPTAERVEFVLECMHRNGGRQEFLYKCSCVIDRIAEQLSFEEFVNASTAARNQGLAGDRGGLFRDPPQVRESAKRYTEIHDEAMKRCDVPR